MLLSSILLILLMMAATTTNAMTLGASNVGKYYVEKIGQNFCSKGTVVSTNAECKHALGRKVYDKRGIMTAYPKGCLLISGGWGYFNEVKVGKSNAKASLICHVGGMYSKVGRKFPPGETIFWAIP